MDRKPVALLAAVALAGCRIDPPYDGAFEIPVAAGILQPELGSPFDEPVAYVANARGGQVVPLFLKQGTFLVDDPTVSFLPANQLPTGARRVLTSAAVNTSPECAELTGEVASAECAVTIFVGDAYSGLLLEVPHVLRMEGGFPVEGWSDDEGDWFDPTWDRSDDDDRDETPADIVFTDAVSGDGAPELVDLELKKGWTTTETWTVTWDGSEAWIVEGTASGRQEKTALSGLPYIGDDRRVEFTVTAAGSCAEGVCDTFTFETRTGVREHDVGGTPLVLAMSPDRSRLAMIVQDALLDVPMVRFFDPATRTQTGDLALPPDSRPGRLSWDAAGSRLFVADHGHPAAWSVDVGNGDALTEIPLPWPIFDVANLAGEDLDRLFVLENDGTTVWTLDLATGELLDTNPWQLGLQGMVMQAPVAGIEALPLEHLYTSYDDEGVRRTGRTVAIVLTTGAVMFLEETTGCLMPDAFGPRTVIGESFSTTGDYDTNYDLLLGPFLESNAINNRHVMVSQCAGTAFQESWVLHHDRNVSGWRVEGARSGEQPAAIEDQRYITEDGAVSFVVRAGAIPSAQGYTITFDVLDGIATAVGDNDADGLPEWLLANPADPLFFSYEVGPTIGSWKKRDVRAFALVLGQAADRVGRVDPQEADVDLPWE
ncbi:MAG: hypothetical protein H0V89_00505 [Deltaproteobacteria bacterium]|nr:hypothetical protein [Deltaproteobacteria bacterium]